MGHHDNGDWLLWGMLGCWLLSEAEREDRQESASEDSKEEWDHDGNECDEDDSSEDSEEV